MKKKIITILFFSAMTMLFSGCGKEETVFDTMSFTQTPMNVSNPITDPEIDTNTASVVEEDRNLYYERYEPTEDYVPTHIADTYYSDDELENEIPNGMLNFKFDRQTLRKVPELIDNYNIAEEGEYTWTYKYKTADRTTIPRNYFQLKSTVSLVGKPKGEESLDFDDLKISTYYDYTNANTIEDFSMDILNAGNTKEVSSLSNKIFDELLKEDVHSILMNSPNTSDGDTTQIYSGSVPSENGNSTYSFYRKFSTPLKESHETVSASFDIKFLDGYTQKVKAKKNIINNQKATISSLKSGFDAGFLEKSNLGEFWKGYSPSETLRKYLKDFPNGDFEYNECKKVYDNFKYFFYSDETNLDPADIITPVARYEFNTKANYSAKYTNSSKETTNIDFGTVDIEYKYEKTNNQFSSVMFHFKDTMNIPKYGIYSEHEKESKILNIDTLVNKRVHNILSTVDIGDEEFFVNYDRSLYTTLNELPCKVTVKVTDSSSGSIYGVVIDVLIESDDIYGVSQTDIVFEKADVEYDLNGNIINDKKEEKETEISEEEIDSVINEDSDNDLSLEEDVESEENTEKIEDNNTSSGGNISDFF